MIQAQRKGLRELYWTSREILPGSGVILASDLQELVKSSAGRGEIGGVAPFVGDHEFGEELRISLAASGILAPSRW